MPVFVIQFTSLLYSLRPRQRLLATASNSIANDVGSKVRCCSNSDQVRCAELKKMAEAVFADPSWRPGLLTRFVGPTAARRPVERRSEWVFFAPHCHFLDGTSVAGDRSPNQGGCHDRQEHFARKARQRRHNRADRRPCRGSKAAGRATHRRSRYPRRRSPHRRYNATSSAHSPSMGRQRSTNRLVKL